MNIIYTCITNGYDTLQPIANTQGFGIYCFIENLSAFKKSHAGNLLPFRHYNFVEIKNATPKIFREIKICPYKFIPDYEKNEIIFDRLIWLDGNLTPTIDLNELVKDKSGFWVMEHPERNNIAEEGTECIIRKKDNLEIILRQLNAYELDGFDVANSGLVATGVIIRDAPYKEFSEAWWNEVKNHSVRDQLSFNYVAWKQNFKYQKFPFLYGFEKIRHNKLPDPEVQP